MGHTVNRGMVGYDTPWRYRSPEMHLGRDNDGSIGSDLWALGCLLTEVRARQVIFHRRDGIVSMANQLGCTLKAGGIEWEVGAGHRQAIAKAMMHCGGMEIRAGQSYPKNTTTEELNAFVDLLTRLWRYRPEDRISAADALRHG